MEKLILRREALTKALKTLEKSLKKLESNKFDDYQELRDSIIQRFEYSTDTFWKYLKDHLRVVMGVEIELARPKSVLKECYDAKIVTKDEFDTCIALIEDRNLTSHGYNEELAEKISQQIPRYFAIMRQLLERLKTSQSSINS